jgi:hypothetical protein
MESVQFMDLIRAMLEIGSKYQIDHLRREAVDRLSAHFPVTFEEWQRSCRQHNSSWAVFPANSEEALAIADRYTLHFLLPAIYMQICCAWTLRQIMQANLPPTHVSKIVIARSDILFNTRNTHVEWTHQPCPYNVRRCDVARGHITLVAQADSPSMDLQHLFYAYWQFEGLCDGFCSDMCKKCQQAFPDEFKRGQLLFWDNLPRHFELGL